MTLIDLLEFFHLMSAPTRYERTGAFLFGKDLQPLGIPVLDHHIFGRSDGQTRPIFKFSDSDLVWMTASPEER